MDFKTFKDSLPQSSPPGNLEPLLQAMWYDAQGDWTKAHAIAQDQETGAGAWVHAYLHRKEGDAANADYWYGRARKPSSSQSTELEWQLIVEALLQATHQAN